MIVNSKSLTALILAVIACSAPGCGGADIPEVGYVTGKVTFDGEPVVGVSVMASPTNGRTAVGIVKEDGTYEIMYKNNVPGTCVGMNKISAVWPTGGSPAIPPEYTNLEFDVQPGKNTFDIEMVTPEGAKKPASKLKPGPTVID